MKIDPKDPKTYKDLPWTTAITRPKRKRICRVDEDFSISGTKGEAGDYVVLNPRPQLLKKNLLQLHFQAPGNRESIMTSSSVKPEDYEFIFKTPEVVAYKNDEEIILIAMEDFGKEGIEPLLRMKTGTTLQATLKLCRHLAENTPGKKHLSSMIESLDRKQRIGRLRKRDAKTPFA